MLDKEICELFGIDTFTQWLMMELDNLEEIIFYTKLDDKAKLVMQSKYNMLKEVRDHYCDYLKKKK